MNSESPRPITAVAALIQNQSSEVLLLKSPKWSGRWALPAGKVEYGEGLEVALIREVKEETGLDIDHLESLMVQEICEPEDFHHSAHFISHAFLAKTNETKVITNEESDDHCWATPAIALELELNSPTKELLSDPVNQKRLKMDTRRNPDRALGTVIVDQLEFDCIIGILPEERVNTQPFRLSLELETCFLKASQSEDVSHTVDYFQLAENTKSMIQIYNTINK